MENFLKILVLALIIPGVIFYFYLIFKKNGKKLFSFVPSIILFSIGGVASAVIYINFAINPGTWGEMIGTAFGIVCIIIIVSFIGLIGISNSDK